MTNSVIFDEPWLTISWDSKHRCVYAEFKAFATSSEFRTGTLAILEAIRTNKAEALVSDNRRLELVTSEDQLWIRDTWTPIAVEAGLRRIAVVLADRGLGKFASETILSEMGDKTFATRTFSSLDEALRWVAAAD